MTNFQYSVPLINKQTYFGAMKDLGYKMDLSPKWWNALNDAYTSSLRHYHTHEKVCSMLTDLDWCVNNRMGITEREYDLVALIIMFADSCFDARDDIWEVQSATLWTEFAGSVGMSDEEKMRGYHCIIGLADHNAYDPLSTILYDADFLVYADNASNYNRFAHQLRAEYKHLSDHEWKTWRLDYLDWMLNRHSIYSNDLVNEIQNELARQNICREITTLRDDPVHSNQQLSLQPSP